LAQRPLARLPNPAHTAQRFLVTDVPLTGAVVMLTEDAQGGPTVTLGAGAIEYVFVLGP
jgi:hypothetical protein